jgi:hypothetical protein
MDLIEKSVLSQKHEFETYRANLNNDVQQIQNEIHTEFVSNASLDIKIAVLDSQIQNSKQNVVEVIEQKFQEKAKALSEELAEIRFTVSLIESAWGKAEERLEGALRGLRDHLDLNQEKYQRERELQEQIYELAQCRLERDAGQLNVRRCCAEWVIPNVRAKADLMPRGTCVTSPAFAVELPAVSPGCRPQRLDGLRLDFYPSGREGSQDGFCSLALRSDSGLPWVRYWLAIAGFRRGPLDPLSETVDDICPLVNALVGDPGKEAVRLSVEFIEPKVSPQGHLDTANLQRMKQPEFSMIKQKLPPFPGIGGQVPQVASLWSSSNRVTS